MTAPAKVAYAATGQPYVAYQDLGNGVKATVMKYDSVYIGINEQQESRLSMYPNPATDKISIETSGTSKESNLAIMNIEGQELITQQVSELRTVIDITTLPSGVYFVRLINDRSVAVRKIVKQ